MKREEPSPIYTFGRSTLFLKQAVGTARGSRCEDQYHDHDDGCPTCQAVVAAPGSKRKAGGVIGLPYLDGVQHAAFPEVPRG